MSSLGEKYYQILLKKGLTGEEIEAAIKVKKVEFGESLSIEGMLFMIAREHGITL